MREGIEEVREGIEETMGGHRGNERGGINTITEAIKFSHYTQQY